MSYHSLSYIIPYIYQSSYQIREQNTDYIVKNFKHIVNCATESFKAPGLHGMSELRLKWSDCEHQELFPEIDISYNYIDSAVSRGENVLIHCLFGISRSSAIILYYLMRKHNLSYNGAFSLLKSQRESIDPNEHFATQLRAWEKNKSQITTEGRNISVGDT